MASSASVPAVDRPARLSVRRNFLWVLGGNTAYAGSQWLMLILLTKLAPPELVGQFALSLALTGPIILFANLQLRSVQATDATGEYSFADYFTLRLTSVGLAVIGILCLALFGGYHAAVRNVIFALGMARAAECLSEIYFGLFQREERMDLIARSLLLKAVLSLAAFAVAIVLTGSLVTAIWALFVAWTVVLVGFDIRVGRRFAMGRFRIQWFAADRRWLRLGWIALPLGAAAMLKAMEHSLPRYFIERQTGERELGLFAAGAYLTVVGVQFVTALSLAAGPRLAVLHAKGERREFLQLMFKLLGGCLVIGLTGLAGAALIGQEVLGLLYTREYAQHHNVLTWLMAAAVFNYIYVPLGTSLNGLRVFRFRLPVHLLALSLLAAACLTLGRSHGLMGIAWAVGLAELFTAGVYGCVLIYHLRRWSNRVSQGEASVC